MQLEASGTRGDILIMWDKRIWEGEGFKWHLTGVYAPNNIVEKEETLWELGATRCLYTSPWV
ncbi:hypothetical protein H5410_046780 [Solanum commersonii]|uniref:Uncharacterized protein n=1 Tax=Solanum commersonii TaxID=4109 RepID=A0A9J5XFA6_SOLCO|nr:hypothetical protein H5410_046780 [Solanum commersonii]